jgi:biotin synthase
MLPSPLNEHCYIVNFNENKVTVYADSALWAIKLRFEFPKLMLMGRQIEKPQVRPRYECFSLTPQASPEMIPHHQTIASLRQQADNLSYQPLKQAFSKLVEHLALSIPIRHNWNLTEVIELFKLPFNDLIFKAQSIHRVHFNANQLQLSTLLNIKAGGCSEDCAYCAQSAHFKTAVISKPLLEKAQILEQARLAQINGATRFCMSTSGASPQLQEFDEILAIVNAVKQLGLEVCMTLGQIDLQQAHQLKMAGLDYYNHNLDTSETYYPEIVTTHTYQERLATLACVQAAGLNVCCGGIIGLGEQLEDRAKLLMTLANLPLHPQSVPINQLVPIAGTPLAEASPIDPFDLVRCVAVARILMPTSRVRLAAGRVNMSDELQALCFLAGANSIFYGDQLLTTDNASPTHDRQLLERLGLST